MTKFSQLAHSPDGRTYLKSIDVSAFEIRLGAKVAIGATLIALAYYAHDFPPGMMVLGVTGVVVLVATCVSTWLILTRDVEAHRWRTDVIPARAYEVDASDATRTIPLISNGVTTQIVIDAKDDELVKIVTKLLDASIKMSSPDVTTFPTTRALGWPYAEYDVALRALGSMVKRGRGMTPSLVHPYTLGTMREAIASGTLLPSRPDATPAYNRIK